MNELCSSNANLIAEVAILQPSFRPCCAHADCFFISDGISLYSHSTTLGMEAVDIPASSDTGEYAGSVKLGEKWSVRVMAASSNESSECFIASASGPLVRVFRFPSAPLMKPVTDRLDPNGASILAMAWSQQIGQFKILAAASKVQISLRLRRSFSIYKPPALICFLPLCERAQARVTMIAFRTGDGVPMTNDDANPVVITPPRPCSSSSVHLAWGISSSLSNGAALLVAWGECIQMLRWNGHAGERYTDTYSSVMGA